MQLKVLPFLPQLLRQREGFKVLSRILVLGWHFGSAVDILKPFYFCI